MPLKYPTMLKINFFYGHVTVIACLLLQFIRDIWTTVKNVIKINDSIKMTSSGNVTVLPNFKDPKSLKFIF